MTIAAQVHDKFKLFTGALDASGNLGAIAGEVAAWVKQAKVAPKSIGIEYVERDKKVILSVGYHDNEPAYGVTIASTKIGPIGKLEAGELGKLEQAMSAVAAKQKSVICHELYVTDANELYIVTMAHA